MNDYIGFYNGKRLEVMTDTRYQAQEKILALFQKNSRNKVKGYQIAVQLAEIAGVQIINTATQ